MVISVRKSIYDPRLEEDGFRVLVMQYWPRGVRKEKVDAWYKDLGTSRELIKAWKAGKLSWSTFKKKYTADLKGKAKQEFIQELAKRARTETVTLLCGCRDPARCHRAILKELIEGAM